MNVLIVYAHQEPKSFNGALRDTAVSVLQAAGHAVQVSDLYRMRFKAVADEDDFAARTDPAFFKYQIEQSHAYERGLLTADIRAEQDKLRWCDALILQFPLWWFSVPAILKGWVDRVFTTGFAYGGGRWYETGGLRGRRAMLALTTGGPATMYSPRGLNGHLDEILFHINHGMLYFVGFDVLPPFVAWAPARVSAEQRAAYLAEYTQRLRTLATTCPLPYRPTTDYDATFQLKA